MSSRRFAPAPRSRIRSPRRASSFALRIVLAVGLLAALCVGPALAQGGATIEVPTTIAQDAGDAPASAFEASTADPILKLSLEDVLGLVLQRNLTLTIQRYDRSSALRAIDQSLGIYDPLLSASFERIDNSRPTTTSLEQTNGALVSEQDTYRASLDKTLAWGTQVSAVFSNRRNETNNTFVTPNPGYTVDLDFSVVQPLLRNFGREVTERGVILARLDSQISRETFERELVSLLETVAVRYWELVEAREQLAVAEESLALAKELNEMNRIQVEVGTKAPLETVQSEAGVAAREEDIIRRTAAVEDAEDVLRRLINLDRGALWTVPIEPTTDPAIAYRAIDLEAAMDAAVAMRPELRSQRLQLDKLDHDARFFANQLKPQLNVEAGYGYNGVGGDDIGVLPDGQVVIVNSGGFTDAVDQIADLEFEGWRVALNFSYPLGNREAKGRKAVADLARQRGGVVLRDLELDVLNQVRRTARGVRTAEKTIDAAKLSRELARKNLEAEQKRYENGLSTSFQVLEIQEDLATARSQEVQAVTNYRKSLIAFDRARGNLTESLGIVLVEPDATAADDGGDTADADEAR